MPFPVDVKYILEAGKELHVEFPEKFKNRMIEVNGGELETDDDDWQIFPFFDKSDSKRIGRTSNHLVLETKIAREWNFFPEFAVAIASNGSGDCLVLLPDENEIELSDTIYLWLHENGDVIKIADSIDDLD